MTAFYDRGLEALDPGAVRDVQWDRFRRLVEAVLPDNRFLASACAAPA